MRTLFMLMWLVVLAMPTLAQEKPKQATITGSRLGYSGVVVPERWTPLWVEIKPGTRPQQVMLTASYEQDATQNADVTTEVATTPGQSLVVPMLVNLPVGCSNLTVTLSGDGARSSVVYARAPEPDQLPLAMEHTVGNTVVGFVDVAIQPALVREWHRQANRYQQAVEARGLSISAADLGQNWAAFDSLNALVMRLSTLERIDQSVVRALRTWVSGGGRLVLICDGPGSRWNAFVPSGGGVTLSDTAEGPTPKGLAQKLAPGSSTSAALRGRVVRIDRVGKAAGWVALYPRQVASIEEDTDIHLGILAYGPVGGGIVVLAGFDPSLVSAQLESESVKPLWLHLLDLALPEQPENASMLATTMSGYGYFTGSSGDGPQGAAALQAIVDSQCDVPPIPAYVYTLLFILGAALALTVSLVDYVLLGWRRWRHRSWLSACLWIALASCFAWWLPGALRGNSTRLARLEVLDQMDASGRPASVWRTGITTLFAARSASIELIRSDNVALSGYWRGASGLVYSPWSRQSSSFAQPSVPLRQRVSALDGSDASVVLMPGMSVRQWTLRTVMDHGPVSGPGNAGLRVRLAGDADKPVFHVGGIDASAVTAAIAYSRWGWRVLMVGADNQGGLILTPASQSGRLVDATERSLAPALLPETFDAWSRPANGDTAASALQLDGPRKRTAAFEMLVERTGCVVLHIVSDGPCPVAASIPSESRGTTLHRVAVPFVFTLSTAP